MITFIVCFETVKTLQYIPIIHTHGLWMRKKAPVNTSLQSSATLDLWQITRFQFCAVTGASLLAECRDATICSMIIILLNDTEIRKHSKIIHFSNQILFCPAVIVCVAGFMLQRMHPFSLVFYFFCNWTNASLKQGVVLYQILQHVALEALRCVGCRSDQCSRRRGLRAGPFRSAPL